MKLPNGRFLKPVSSMVPASGLARLRG
jgi:hypothetical protein